MDKVYVKLVNWVEWGNSGNKLIKNVQGLVDVLGEKQGKKSSQAQMELIEAISLHLNEMKNSSDEMLEKRKIANKIESIDEKALAYCDNVKGCFDAIRYHADKLEMLIDDEIWPLPKFRELLFTR